MTEITCEEREETWRPKMRPGVLMVGSASTNFMGDGVVETVWVWAGTEVECLRERMEYTPGRFPDPSAVESCRHWVLDQEEDDAQ